MPFPTTERLLYRKNPLIEVICQLRFPSILKIDAEPPAAFQEALKEDFPDLRVAEAPASAKPRVAYDFLSEDGVWKVSLNRDFVALTTTKYERWEDFRALLEKVVRGIAEIYSPSHLTRAGLRYRDVIDRSALGLTGTSWKELLRPEISAELASDDVGDDVVEAMRRTLLTLSDVNGYVRLHHGLAEMHEAKETVYLIDADFYTEERMAVADAFRLLDRYNRLAGSLFRWCIKDKLHVAMDPVRP